MTSNWKYFDKRTGSEEDEKDGESMALDGFLASIGGHDPPHGYHRCPDPGVPAPIGLMALHFRAMDIFLLSRWGIHQLKPSHDRTLKDQLKIAGIEYFSGYTCTFFACKLKTRTDSVILYKEAPVDSFVQRPNKWAEVKSGMKIPSWADMSGAISFYLYNPGATRFYVDDIVIRFE